MNSLETLFLVRSRVVLVLLLLDLVQTRLSHVSLVEDNGAALEWHRLSRVLQVVAMGDIWTGLLGAAQKTHFWADYRAGDESTSAVTGPAPLVFDPPIDVTLLSLTPAITHTHVVD